jgi:hypothetical protein
MKLRVVTVVAALLCPAVFSMAQAAEQKTAPAPGSPDEVVCTFEQTTGSHLGHKVCATRRAREERAKEDQEALQSMQRSGAKSSSGTAIGR